jgi:glycosyltransferase involved in cell wall biosynthesis
MADLAIVICTYDPIEEIFSRTLRAVQKLTIPADTIVECVIVDNNNVPQLVSRPYVAEFLASTPWASVVTEARQGLAYGRVAGIEATTAPIVIFFDDDNEPAADYLCAARDCVARHPEVYVWGPGKTVVDFISPVSQAFRKEYSGLFQEREFGQLQYGCVPAKWEAYYPFGTGMVVWREVMQRYADRLLSGALARPGRSGRKLSSGEDIQIVWEAVKMGKAAGVAPTLRMTHIISTSRASLQYIAKLVYGTGSSYLPALVESFPGERPHLEAINITNYEIVRRLLRIAIRNVLRMRYAQVRVEMARYLGSLVGHIDSTRNNGEKRWVRALAIKLDLE